MELTYDRLKQAVVDWRHHRFLKKHGCNSQRQYDLKYDIDHNIRATCIKDIYHGYPHVFPIRDYHHPVYKGKGTSLCFPSYDYLELIEWCNNNCKGKWRHAWHMVIQNYSGEWEVNSIGGAYWIFFAFKDPKDASMFILKWA